MKTGNMAAIAVCPLCGKAYRGYPALSRTDNVTPICPDCGIRQALASIGIAPDEQEKILAVIHGAEGRAHGEQGV